MAEDVIFPDEGADFGEAGSIHEVEGKRYRSCLFFAVGEIMLPSGQTVRPLAFYEIITTVQLYLTSKARNN